MKAIAFLPLREGDTRNTWEIDDISDPRAFMRFVFSHATPQDRWICQGFDREATRALLRPLASHIQPPTRFLFFQFGADDIEVPMDAATRTRAAAVLDGIDLDREPKAQHVTDGRRRLLVSYDNLSCCWVSKEIPRERMELAAAEYRFHFIDPDKQE